MATIELKGTYKQKTEIFGHVLSHHEGTFDVKPPLDGPAWSGHFGPASVTASVLNGQTTVTASAFGLTETLFHKGINPGTYSHKLEIDSGNLVDLTVVVSP